MTLRSRNKISPNFNMSSMTDIVFLLLVFFMLTSTLVSPNALKLLLPNSKAKTLEKQTISVSITKEIDFYINDKSVDINNLESNIISKMESESDPAIILHADKTVDIEHIVKVMDIAYRNKYKIVLATSSIMLMFSFNNFSGLETTSSACNQVSTSAFSESINTTNIP